MISKRLMQTVFNESLKATVALRKAIDDGNVDLQTSLFTNVLYAKVMTEILIEAKLLDELEHANKMLEQHYTDFVENKFYGKDDE